MGHLIYFYPKWLRAWHQTNALMFLMLIITGLSMQYGLFFIRFDVAVSIHNICGIILALSYLLFIFGNLLSGNYKYYLLKLNGFFKELGIQFRYYCFGIFKKETPPFPISSDLKFNPLQKLSYVLLLSAPQTAKQTSFPRRESANCRMQRCPKKRISRPTATGRLRKSAPAAFAVWRQRLTSRREPSTGSLARCATR